MTDGCLKVKEAVPETQRSVQNLTGWADVGWVSVTLSAPSTRSTDHQEHIPSLLKNPISYYRLVSLLYSIAVRSYPSSDEAFELF